MVGQVESYSIGCAKSLVLRFEGCTTWDYDEVALIAAVAFERSARQETTVLFFVGSRIFAIIAIVWFRSGHAIRNASCTRCSDVPGARLHMRLSLVLGNNNNNNNNEEFTSSNAE